MGDHKFDISSFDNVECLEIDETNQMIAKSFDIEENCKTSIQNINEESQIGRKIAKLEHFNMPIDRLIGITLRFYILR